MNAKRMKLEWKFIFVGSKDSLTRTSKPCYIVVEASKQLSYRTPGFDVPDKKVLIPI